MDLRHFLTHSILLLKKEEIGKILGPDARVFHQLVNHSFSREMPLCWRATWIMDYLSELYPWLAENYLKKVWAEIPNKHPNGVTRSALRMLCRYDIPEEFQGIAADLCLEWLTLEFVPVAIKAYSMEILYKIARMYPELKNEFILIIEEQTPNNSAGFKARGKQIIKALKKL